ncbi:hypothetical protein MKX01_021460 [Papaver californicum]|nr:hypothetical protein MKX01_021460 [Papaver californicum]
MEKQFYLVVDWFRMKIHKHLYGCLLLEDVNIEDYLKTMTFHVAYNVKKYDVHCTCQKYTFKGIQCRHDLSVLCYNKVRKLPDKYILRWWRKDVIKAHTNVKVGFSCWTNDASTKCYHNLCIKFSKLAD